MKGIGHKSEGYMIEPSSKDISNKKNMTPLNEYMKSTLQI
jgi:hypothetical protein